MRLFEAIVDANHRAIAGDSQAGLHPADFADDLPVIALTCVDPRLNALFPSVLGLPGDQFIWLRNAGNIITGPLSSTMRSLALACAIKGGKEIAIIGHSDCQVCKTTTMDLLDRLKGQGIDRHSLPDNLAEFFGMSGSERQNVLKAADFARQSPLVGPRIPVHGLMVDVGTGKLEWLINGYQNWQTTRTADEIGKGAGAETDAMKTLPNFQLGEMKFPDAKIGDLSTGQSAWSSPGSAVGSSEAPPLPPAQAPPPPPPIPPRLRVWKRK